VLFHKLAVLPKSGISSGNTEVYKTNYSWSIRSSVHASMIQWT